MATYILRGDDDGEYYVHETFTVGGSNNLAWFGAARNRQWGNVFFGHGVFNGQILEGVVGDWYDIPYGRALRSGTLALDYTERRVGAPRLRATAQTGGFGGTRWSAPSSPRYVDIAAPSDRPTGEGLTGVWITNTGALYYIRQIGTTVVWFGGRPDGAAANVFKGVRDDARLVGKWYDVPWGRTRNLGTLTLALYEGDDLMRQETASSAFGSARWIKL